MADSQQTPTLASTADPTPYVPVSWMAVSAMVVSGLFLALLIIFIVSDIFSVKKPLLGDKLLILPAIGLVLSFAARRMIRNSEGTRSGEKLASLAWWISVLSGAGYATYLFTIDYAVRREAGNKAEAWVYNLINDDPNDPEHKLLGLAFISTLDPDRRQGILKTEQIESQYRDSYLAFRQIDIVRMIRRNRGECQFVPGGVKEWIERPNGVDCLFSGTMKCLEGSFVIEIPMKGLETQNPNSKAAGGREWMLAIPGSGVFAQDRSLRTPYGWMLETLERSGNEYGKDFMAATGPGMATHVFADPSLRRFTNGFGVGPNAFPIAYHRMIAPESRKDYWESAVDASFGRWALCGGLAAIAPFRTSESSKYLEDSFFKLPGGDEPTLEQKNQFRKAWNTLGLIPPGSRMRNNPDRYSTLAVKEQVIEVQLPCELPLPGEEVTGIRCRLVITCNEPAVLEELKRFRDSAKSDTETLSPPDSMRYRKFNWRIVRLESDLRPFVAAQPQRPGTPSGGGGQPGTPPIPGS
jgi:hypothetical protein